MKIFRKLVSTPLISFHYFSTKCTKYAKLRLHATKSLLAIHICSIRPYNRLLKMKTDNKQKFRRKVPEESVAAI